MKVYVVSMTRSISKAAGPIDSPYPVPVFFLDPLSAKDCAAGWCERYGLQFHAYEVEAKITRKLKRPASIEA